MEYKRGHSKPDERDEVQLAAQVICLEEMHNIRIDRAFLFYGETRRREEIIMDEQLRILTQHYADEMHRIYSSGVVPKAVKVVNVPTILYWTFVFPITNNFWQRII